MSTDNCKKLIENISEENGFDKKTKWKRVKKYKEGSLILRDFQNSENDIIVISEDNTGSYSLFEIKKNVKLSEEISKNLTKEKLLLEWFKLAGNIIKIIT